MEWGAANDSRLLGRGGLRGPEFPCMKHMCGDESMCNWWGHILLGRTNTIPLVRFEAVYLVIPSANIWLCQALWKAGGMS